MKRLLKTLADPVLLFNTPPAHLARIVRSRWRHRNSHIYSPYIHDQARLSPTCVLSHGVVVGAGVELGQRSYLNRDAMVFSGRLGDFCSVGYGSIIGPAQHPVGDMSTSPQIYRDPGLESVRGVVNEFPDPPHIGCDVWIGNGVTVLQGVSIGHGAVIGAGAVITHSVAPYHIVGGVPARVIRPRFAPAAVEFLLAEKWWERVTFEGEASARPQSTI